MIQLVLDAIGNLDNVAWCMSREMTQEVEKYMRRLMGNLTSLKSTIQNELRWHGGKHLDALSSLALSQDLANDTIRIALHTVGYEQDYIAHMNQFDRASALIDMAQELAALTDKRHATLNFETVTKAWANGRGYNGRVYKERTA